ncbi:phosphoribosylformylglycinamidine synthase subunit I [Paucidesulfovibrio gracilis DSM 16080]|uniref:Phosphoribosylformylglycinamidine synthase subunit I n=1 Tax=Paucidesulfovibrio gracilis DSM 16080 TaxID=1121449 RepID=A0A1T4WMD0_9BACT|nr:phosphoribosylformylglycinamidine synthase subunit PurQ [Paucidesulfovibrio gracilis]SKA78307.1 phosphoribosylformylglycinamidine synthase subunit I [Paucidesulfovibrio gracilis DSM 16080]
MAPVNALVLTGYGTNCEQESAHAVRLAGADSADIVYFSDLASGKVQMQDYNFLLCPGGFLDGDDLGAAQAAALRWRHATTPDGRPLLDQFKEFFKSGAVILGICNGFQLLVKLGLLPALGGQYFDRQVSLSHNDSARYEDRWVHLRVNPKSPCVFTQGLDKLFVPVRHGEGKIIPRDEHLLRDLAEHQLIALQYADPQTGEPTQEYPHNPNGSPLGIAGLTDPSGRVLGLMPHPEAYNHPTNHPTWTRGHDEELGLRLLERGVLYLRER